MSTQIATNRSIRVPARFTALAIAFAILTALAILLPSTRPAANPSEPTVVNSGAPMRHLTGSVYEPSQAVFTAPVVVSSSAPMQHLTGSVYEPSQAVVANLVAFPNGAPMTHLTGSVYEER